MDEPGATHLAGRDESGLLEHAQVLEYRVPPEVGEHPLELPNGLPVGTPQGVQEGTSMWVRKGADRAVDVVGGHAAKLGDCRVTCQRLAASVCRPGPAPAGSRPASCASAR